MKHKKLLGLILILIFSIHLVACGSGSSSFYNYRTKTSVESADNYSNSYEQRNMVSNSDNTLERREVKSYEIGADTREFKETYTSIKNLVEVEKGYVDNSSYNNENIESVNMTVFIPKDNVEKFLESVKKINTFNLLYEREYASDAEDAYTDIETRLDSLEKRLNKLYELQKEQTDVDTILNLEDRISDTINQIENLKGNKKNLDSVVEYSRIDISLVEVYTSKDTNQKQEVKMSDEMRDNFKETGEFYKQLFRLCLYLLIKYGPILIIVLIIAYISRKKKPKKENSTKEKIANKEYKENK